MSALRPALSEPRAKALRWTGLAFLYWLGCMAALEPGNVAGMLDAGQRPDWGREVLRLMAAGALGASVTPVLAVLVERLPLPGPRRHMAWLGLAILGLAILGLAAGLVMASTVLAAWLLEGRWAPRANQVGRELFANGLLLVVCLAGFTAILQAARRWDARPSPAPQGWLTHLPIRARGRWMQVDLDAVDWIETQGNYQALHAGEAIHLARETSARLEARLDPARFARIHRRVIVALSRVAEVRPLANGDGLVRLITGAELRLARSFREAFRARLEGR